MLQVWLKDASEGKRCAFVEFSTLEESKKAKLQSKLTFTYSDKELVVAESNIKKVT